MVSRFLLCTLFMFLAACTSDKAMVSESGVQKPSLHKVGFDQLPGWREDNLNGAFQAFLKSCDTLTKKDANKAFRPFGTYGAFYAPCRAAQSLKIEDAYTLTSFFETWFDPYLVKKSPSQETSGLFTGYYEASLNGSLRRYGPYQTPLYGMPTDLATADLGQWYEELEGKNITVQIKDGKIARYPDRAVIERQGLPKAEVVAWVDDPVDAFFLQIQGSGVVTLENGRQMRIGYAGKNGHGYFAIGRALIERGELTKEEVSLQTIRKWLADHPTQAQDLMNLNPSYVFFRKLETSGPVGAQGVVLTPNRSLAVDRTLYDYGMPIWLNAEHPDPTKGQITQMMVAQDTGGAIKGVVRGDFFWGYGPAAEKYAGEMKSEGRYWFLLPKTISTK